MNLLIVDYKIHRYRIIKHFEQVTARNLFSAYKSYRIASDLVQMPFFVFIILILLLIFVRFLELEVILTTSNSKHLNKSCGKDSD